MEQKTKIIIETDAGRSEQILQAVKKGMQDVGNEAEKTSQKTKNSGDIITSAFDDIAKDITKTTLTAAGFGIAIKSAYDLAKDASALSEARQSLQTYAAEIGVSYEKLMTASKEATGRQIDDLKLIQLNHEAMKNGVSRNVDDLSRLWEVSSALGDDYGKSMDEKFKFISDAITSGNSKALLSIGLLPASFKRASDAGSLLERRAELLKAVLEQAGVGADSLAKNGDTAADKFDRFEASTTNLKRSLGEALLPVVTPIVEGLTAIADAAEMVINKFAELADISGPKNPFLGKTLEELQQLRTAAANRVGTAQSNLNALTDPSQSYKRAGESDITTKIMSAEVQYQGELAILKQIDSAMENLQKRVEARKQSEEKVAQAIADNAAKEAESSEKKKLAGEAEKQRKNELTEAQNRLTKAIEATEKATTEVSTAFLNSFGTKTITSLKDAQDLLTQMTAAAGGFAVGLQNGTTEAGKLYEKLKKVDEYNENWLSMLRNSGTNAANDLRGLTPDNAMAGMMNFASGGLWSAQGKEIKNAIKETQEPLAKTIAEAVTAGFANADFSNLELTLGNVLSSVLTKVVAQKNPVIDSAGAINWGNLGVNLAASYGAKLISGLFTTKEKNKEAIQQASNLEATISSAYLKTFESELLPYIAGESTAMGGYLKDQLYKARMGINGISVGYTYDKDWSWGDLSWQKEYQLNAPGASNALENLNYWNKAAEKYNEQQKRNLELMSAGGQSFKALAAQTEVYTKAAATAGYTYDNRTLSWTGYGDRAGINTKYETDLSDEIHELLITQTELARQLGAATAERSTNAAAGFAKYAPWLENIYMPNQYSQQSSTGNGIFSPVVRGIPMPGFDGYSASVDGLSRDAYYDAFEKLQNDFADRKLSPGLFDMVKEASDAKFELEKLRVTGSDDYAEAYLDYLKKQTSAIEEVMERQAAILNDSTRTFEEQAAALANYEAAREAYHKAELDTLVAEQAAKESIKQKELEAAARSRDRMASALNLYGEIAQAGTKIYVLTGGKRDIAYDELIRQNSDDPAVVSALKGAEVRNDGMVLWGEK